MSNYHLFLYVVFIFYATSCKKTNTVIPTTEADKKWTVTTIAGDGTPTFADGPASTSRFRTPLDVTVAEDGSIYVADALNHRIRKIFNDQVTTIAGFVRKSYI